MIRKISTILLSLLMVWYAAAQVQGDEKTGGGLSGIHVHAQGETVGEPGEEIYGQIRVTAALRDMLQHDLVRVRFVLEGEEDSGEAEVRITPDSWNEKDMLSASAVFMDLHSGTYTLRIENTSGAELEYILAENGDESKYMIEGDTITFELSDSARMGSAWFMLKETEADGT